MLYALKIATRYLTANKAQTSLLVFGVAVGVFIFIFMTALIGGLAEFILSRTAGDLSPCHHRGRGHATRPCCSAMRRHHPAGPGEGLEPRRRGLTNADTFIPLIESAARRHRRSRSRSPAPGS